MEQIHKVHFMCECNGHRCELSKCASLSFGFQEILRVRLSLTVELFADALHRNNRFTRWASGREDDTIFGSLGNAFDISWKGMMALAYPPQADLDLDRFADKLRTELGNSLPTRIVLVLEEGKLLEELRNWDKVSVLCIFPAGSFPTISPSSFRQPYIEHKTLRQVAATTVVIVQNREATIRYPIDAKALVTALGRWSRRRQVVCNVEALQPLSLEMENLGRAWTLPGVLFGSNDGKLNWFDGPPAVAKVVALEPHKDGRIQKALDKVFNFDRHVGALGLIPGSICKMIAKAVNPSNCKAGRLVEKAHVSKLSQIIFFSTFGVWMERKRREAAWKSRDKVNSKKSALSRHGRRDEQKVDGMLNRLFAAALGF